MIDEVRYEIVIYWSSVDEAFIAEVPELPGFAADGATYKKRSPRSKLSSASGSTPPRRSVDQYQYRAGAGHTNAEQ